MVVCFFWLVVADILNKPLTITYNYAITNSSGTWLGAIRPTYSLGGTNQSVSKTNISGTHKETVTLTNLGKSSYGILISGLLAGITVIIMQLRLTIPLIFIILCHLINNERKNTNWSINY